MAPKSVTFRRHDHLVSVLFGDLLSHSYNNTFSMFLYLVEDRNGHFNHQKVMKQVMHQVPMQYIHHYTEAMATTYHYNQYIELLLAYLAM